MDCSTVELCHGGCPLVSVIVPLFNHQRFIVRCLESVVADAYPTKELLVVDDGSSDESLGVARAWQASNASRFHGRFEILSRENRGLTRTLNELVGMARGDFVVPLASDDYLLPGGLARRRDYLLAHPTKMAVMGDCVVVDHDDVRLHDSGLEGLHRGRKVFLGDERLLRYEIVFHWCVPGPVLMARREAYLRIGGYDEGNTFEDLDLYLRLVAHNLLGFVDVPVAAYRLHGANYSGDPRRQDHYDMVMQRMFANNVTRFSGLRWAYIVGKLLKLRGVIARREGRGLVRGFLARKVGRALIVVTRLLYDVAAPLVCRFLAAPRGD